MIRLVIITLARDNIMSDNWFASIKLEGNRYNGKSVPVNVATAELSAYYGLLVEAARLIFIQRYPGERWDKNEFDNKVQLHLGKIGEGSSVMPILKVKPEERLKSIPLLEIKDDVDYLELLDDSRDYITECIEEVFNPERPVPPESLAPGFDKIGKSLHTGERIGLETPRKSGTLYYTREISQKFSELYASSYSEDAYVKATYRSFTQDTQKFQVRLDNGMYRSIPLRLAASKEDIRHAASAGVGDKDTKTHLRIHGRVRFDAHGNFIDFEKIYSVEALPNTSIGSLSRTLGDAMRRLDELGQLEDGWLDGEGQGPNELNIILIKQRLQTLVEQFDVPIPYLYPTVDGGIQAEWSLGSWEVSATFCQPRKRESVELFATDTSRVDIDVYKETEMGILTDSELVKVAEFIKQFIYIEEEESDEGAIGRAEGTIGREDKKP